MNDTTISLKWGLSIELPDTATAAWGARLIDYSGAPVDLVWDRQDLSGPDKDTLLAKLNGEKVLKEILDRINECRLTSFKGMEPFGRYPDYETPMVSYEANTIVVYDEGGVIAVANTNRSHGYVYVTAFYVPPTEEV